VQLDVSHKSGPHVSKSPGALQAVIADNRRTANRLGDGNPARHRRPRSNRVPAPAPSRAARPFLRSLLLAAVAAPLLAGPATNAPSARVPDPDEESILQGRYVYERNCQVCHGRWGDGHGEMARDMFPKPRRLTSGVFKYHTTPPGKLPTDADLERTIRGGLAGTSMPAFAALPDRDVHAAIAYVKTLSSRWHWATNHAASVEMPAAPDWMNDASARAPHAAAGAALFVQLCAPCHGPAADGKGPSAATLEDQWGQPAPPPDLRQPVARVGPEPRDLYRPILNGIDGTPMASFAATTTEEQRWDLVAFVLRRRAEFAGEGKP
jgi:mono/diheme cytochrome c family protein